MNDSKWWIEATLSRAKESIVALVAIAGVIWFFGKPLVDGYIEDAIAQQGYASQSSVTNLNGKTFQNGQKIGEIREQQARQDQKLESIQDVSKETRDLLYQLLQQNRNRN